MRYNEQRGLFYRKEMHWIMKQYKVQVYLPPEALYDIRAAVNRIKEVHPYERPVINVFLLDDLSF